MRADHARRRPRSAPLALAVLLAAGLGAGVLAATQAASRDGAPATAASAAPAVTVTAAPPANAPITAPASDDSTIDLSGAAPTIAVTPRFDLHQHSIDDPASPWVVVNKRRALEPETWAPPRLEPVPGGYEMTPEAADALAAMQEAAADAGAGFSTGTAYRGHGFQAYLYGTYVDRWGRERADSFSARPGYSEHQTGLAIDIYQSAACRLKPCFGDEPAGRWVVDHGHEFGFITRYPDAAEDVTGYRYEPWHVRYVGVDLATHMHDEGLLTLEDVFGLEPAPTYE